MMLSGGPNDLKAVIFDLDGVLFDSEPSNVAFYNYILERMGLPPMGPTDVEVIHRETAVNSLRHLVGEGEPHEKAIAIWQEMDPAKFVPKIKLFPHVRECLDLLGSRVDLAVATNRTTTTRLALEHFDLWKLFKIVVSALDTGKSKPDTSFMDACLKGLQTGVDQVVYVGDSSADEQLCLSSGARMIAFRNPRLEAWAHIDDLLEIPKLLGLDK